MHGHSVDTPPPRHRGSRVLSFQGTSQCCEGREGLGPAAGQWGLYSASSPPPWGGGGGVLTLCSQRCWVWLQETKESFVLGEKPLFQTLKVWKVSLALLPIPLSLSSFLPFFFLFLSGGGNILNQKS